MRRLITFIVPLVALALAPPVAAGTVVKIEQRQLPDGTPSPVTIDVQGNLVAMNSGDSRVIFRGDRQEMLIVDDTKKSYLKVTPAMAEGIARQVDAATAQMEAAISKLPADQQAMARRMMQQQQQQARQRAPQTQTQEQVQLPSAASRAAATADTKRVDRTTATATREGYPCVKYEVYDGLEKTQELWVTDWNNVTGHAELHAALQSLMDYQARLTSSLGRLGGAGSSMAGASLAQWWHGIDGVPVVTTEFENGKAAKESVVRSVGDQSIAPATFEVPAGYTEQKLGG
jgi:hypothetical protein